MKQTLLLAFGEHADVPDSSEVEHLEQEGSCHQLVLKRLVQCTDRIDRRGQAVLLL